MARTWRGLVYHPLVGEYEPRFLTMSVYVEIKTYGDIRIPYTYNFYTSIRLTNWLMLVGAATLPLPSWPPCWDSQPNTWCAVIETGGVSRRELWSR